MTETLHPVLVAAGQYRTQLLAQEDAAVNRLIQAYGTSYQRLGAQIEALVDAVPVGPMTRRDALELSALRALRQQIADELVRFGVIADNELVMMSRHSIGLGLDHSTGLVEAYFQNPQALAALRASMIQLAPAQVESLLGFLADGSPLREGLTAQLGPAVSEAVSSAMVDGLVRGMNPRTTADLIRREYGQGLTWALNTVRTANLWAYREATRANYVANSKVVSGWTWYASLDRRTCFSCLAQHGTKHRVGEVLNDHHQGRCVAIPDLHLATQLGLSLPEIEPGEAWFNRQPTETQAGIMGPGMLAAYRAGAVQFNQASVAYEDPNYGPMLRTATMQELGLEEYRQR